MPRRPARSSARAAACSTGCATSLPEADGRRDVAGRRPRPRVPRASREGAASAAWLELAVDADVGAVEAVSEILGRVAPGGTSVEPAFELVDEGLGARIDSTRPATVC